MEKEQIIQLIFNAIESTNILLPDDQKLEKKLNEIIFGGEKIDSLGILNLFIEIESQFENTLQQEVMIIDNIISMEEITLTDINTIVDFIANLDDLKILI